MMYVLIVKKSRGKIVIHALAQFAQLLTLEH